MHTNDIMGSRCRLRNCIDVLIRGVGRKDRSRLTDLVKLSKNFLFKIKIFEYSFNHHVNISDVLIVCCSTDQSNAFIHFVRSEFPFLNRDIVILFNYPKSTLKRLFSNFQHDNRNPDVSKAHSYASSHRPAADDRHLVNRSLRRAL